MQDADMLCCEFWLDVEAAAMELTRKQREALALWLQGYTQEEIGERLGVTQQAIDYRLDGAIRRIQEILN